MTKINLPVMRSNALVEGILYGMAFYDDKSKLFQAKLLHRPPCSVNDMGTKDRFIFENAEGEKIEFFRNNCFPHYLETRRPGRRGERNMRVTFYAVSQEATNEKTAPVAAAPESEKPTTEMIAPAEAGSLAEVVEKPKAAAKPAPANEDPKPVRENFESRGKYNHAMKQWRKRNPEAAIGEEVTA